jgi:molecular chaperone DnaK (HSP70)
MLHEAERWRQVDANRRKIIELKNEADTFISQVEEQIAAGNVKDENLKRVLTNDIEELRKAISK